MNGAQVERSQDRLTFGEVEAIARLILRDEPIRILPGEWWAYNPSEAVLSYPRGLLSAWPVDKVLGAICHEIAEVLYTGLAGADIFIEFARAGEAAGVGAQPAMLLLNAVNDLRVNRLYLREFGGSRPFFNALYGDEQALDPKDDVKRRQPGAAPLPHHQFIDALTCRWAQAIWPKRQTPAWPEAVSQALNRTWPAVQRAYETSSLETTAGVLLESVLPIYRQLVDLSRRQLLQEAAQPITIDDEQQSRLRPSDGDEPDVENEAAKGYPETEGPGTIPDSGQLESWVVISDKEPKKQDEEEKATPPAPSAADRLATGPGFRAASWGGGIVQRFHRLNRKLKVDYENFDYVGAVKSLEPQINAVISGPDGSNGLAAILNTRRFGSADPWRRPRRSHRGDTGELDLDHPENLLINPDIAFLKGIKRRRDDGQKDFANVILLDISGSVIQRGYQSKKFAQLVDTLVVFCEIHERLKLPYQLMAFSENPRVLRSFAECRYEHLHLDPTSAYVVKDFSHLVSDLYLTDHAETLEAPAIELALNDISRQRGLKTILMVTDGISSDRESLVRVLHTVEERNAVSPAGEAVMLLAFGLGLSEAEFKASYEPVVNSVPLRCSRGQLVPNIEALPAIICNAVESRIRNA